MLRCHQPRVSHVGNALRSRRLVVPVLACSSAAANPSGSHGNYRRRKPEEVNCGIFQLNGSGPVPMSMLDIRDAVEACDISSTPEQRRRCFETFGLDSRKVDAYYCMVQDMESHLDQDDETGRRVAGAFGFSFFLLVAQKLL